MSSGRSLVEFLCGPTCRVEPDDATVETVAWRLARVVRIVVVGDRKLGEQCGKRVVTDSVPRRELDRRGDWEAYVHVASAAIVVVDTTEAVAAVDVVLKWTQRLATIKNMPVALLLDAADSTHFDRGLPAPRVRTTIAAFTFQSSLRPVVGTFFRGTDDSHVHDDTGTCVDHLVRAVHHAQRPHRPPAPRPFCWDDEEYYQR